MANKVKNTGTQSAGTAASKGGTTKDTGSGEQDVHVTHQWVRDMMDNLEKHTETKMAALNASIDAKLARLDSVPTFLQLVVVVGGAAVGAVTLVLAIVAYGGDRFDGGSQFGSFTVEQTLRTRQLSDENTRQIGEIGKRVDMLLDIMGRRIEEKPR